MKFKVFISGEAGGAGRPLDRSRGPRGPHHGRGVLHAVRASFGSRTWSSVNWVLSLLAFPLATALPATSPAAGLAPPSQDYVLRFGGSQIAIAPLAPSLDLGTEFTLESWVYLEAASPYGIVMGKTHDPRAEDPWLSYTLSFTATGRRVEFVQTTGQLGSYRSATAPSDLPLFTWTHVAATLGGGTMRLFINGKEVASSSSPGTPESRTVPFAIGNGATPDSGITCCGLKGAMRQPRVWNRALTASELRDNAERYLTGNEAGLVAYWPLDDGTGQAVRDLRPNGTNLYLGTTTNPDSQDPRWVATSILDAGPFFALEEFQIPASLQDFEGKLIDFDSDGDLDVLVFQFHWPKTSGPMQAFRNDGQGRFSDATSEVLAEQDIQTTNARDFAVADVNGDGLMDIFIGESGEDVSPWLGGQSRLLIQTADGKLLDETTARLPVLRAYTHSVTAGDIDGDGDIDIYVGNCCGIGSGSPGEEQQRVGPRLYINDGTGHFTPDTTRLPSSLTDLEKSYTASRFVDVDKDGDLDLILGGQDANPNWPPHTVRDAILLNNGKGQFGFAPESAMPLRYGGSGWGTVHISTADFDRDGWPDLLMTLVRDYSQEARLQLLLNNGDGTFRDASDRIPQSWPTSNAWVKWTIPADFNADGWMDFVTNGFGMPPRLYLNVGNAQFMDVSELLPAAIHPTYNIILPADLDNDGDIDLFVMNGGGGNYAVARNLKPINLVALSLGTSGVAFRPGVSLVVSVGVDNLGLAATADFYFGALLPDGDTVVFFTDLAFSSAVGRLSNPATLKPIVAGVDLTAPFVFNQPSFFTYTWQGGEPGGSYVLFVAAVRPGALADNSVDAGDIVVLATSIITFTP